MNQNTINSWIQTDQVRLKSVDKTKIDFMIKSSELTVKVTKTIKLDDDGATLIYREMYEAIRQLGDAKLGILGLEPRNHEVSMEALKDMNIKNKILLNHLTRFKSIRHDINYRGFRTSVSQSEEIIDFWDKCGKEIVSILRKELKT